MYRVNDVVVNGQRISNIFNTQDEAFHSKYTKPIGGFWTLSRILELEPLMDETIHKFVSRLGNKFADNPKMVCMMDDWLTYCTMLNPKTWQFESISDQKTDLKFQSHGILQPTLPLEDIMASLMKKKTSKV